MRFMIYSESETEGECILSSFLRKGEYILDWDFGSVAVSCLKYSYISLSLFKSVRINVQPFPSHLSSYINLRRKLALKLHDPRRTVLG